MGNPPYIRHEEIKEIKPYLKTKYSAFSSMADLLTYFIELGFNVLNTNGIFQYIISNKFARANYGKDLRRFLINNTVLTHYVDFSGLSVFDEAAVDAAILGYQKSKSEDNIFTYVDIQKAEFEINNFDVYLKRIRQNYKQNILTENSWAFESTEILQIKTKIENKGTVLKNWDILINYGVKTGFNAAFTIDETKKNELITLDPKNIELIKPLLRGRDIEKYQPNFQNIWLITTFPSLHLDISKFVGIENHLKSFGKKRLEQTGEKGSRKKTSGKWFETQDSIGYWKEFEKPKIIYKDISTKLTFLFDKDSYYTNNTNYFITSSNSNLLYLTALLNSQLIDFYYRLISTQLGQGAVRLFTQFVEQIPIIVPQKDKEQLLTSIATNIIQLKEENPKADTTQLEQEIDVLVYQLYGLTYEEVLIVDPTFHLSKETYEALS
nr:TaqI-like C-terminal specificity domain-containing protein [Okeania sp. SIO1F9]